MDAVTGPSSVSGWDDLARVDPLWAIVSQSDKRYGRWNLQDFLAPERLKWPRFSIPVDDLGFLEMQCSRSTLAAGLGG